MERIKTTVRIGGRDYTISGTDSEEHIKRVAVYVDRRMEELVYATRLPQPMVAVLTAMNIADDLMKAQDENTRLRKQLMKVVPPLTEQVAGQAEEKEDSDGRENATGP